MSHLECIIMNGNWINFTVSLVCLQIQWTGVRKYVIEHGNCQNVDINKQHPNNNIYIAENTNISDDNTQCSKE